MKIIFMRILKTKNILYVTFFLVVFSILFFLFLTLPPFGITKDIQFGVSFSKVFAEKMGLNWRDAYLAILDDLRPKSLRLPVYWNDVERESGAYNFDEYDFMINEAENRNINLILVVGRKLPRWPECHEPLWTENKETEIKNRELLKFIEKTVLRYRDYKNIYGWQVENEPFLPFGECPSADADFLDKEINLVHSLDGARPVITSDSGELGLWFRSAKRGDIFGTTMYRIVWHKYFGYIKYPLPPKFFWLKANFVRLFYKDKPILVSELQAEPWSPRMLNETSFEEQAISMDLNKFYDNINYARQVGFSPVYLWGAEWWYLLKVENDRPEFWEAAKNILNNQ